MVEHTSVAGSTTALDVVATTATNVIAAIAVANTPTEFLEKDATWTQLVPVATPPPYSQSHLTMYPGQTYSVKHSAGSITSPSLLALAAVVLSVFVAVAFGRYQHAVPRLVRSPAPASGPKDNQASISAAASTPNPPKHQHDYRTVYHALPWIVFKETKPARPRKPKRVMSSFATRFTRAVTTVAVLIAISAIIPMAFAEATGDVSMHEPSTTPSVTNTAVLSTSSDAVPGKDRPQTWFWNSSGDRPSPNPLLLIMPLILIFSGLLPALAAYAILNRPGPDSTADNTVVTGHQYPDRQIESPTSSLAGTTMFDEHETLTLDLRTAQSELSPVWVINHSTTTVTLPAAAATAPPCTEAIPANCPGGVNAQTWNPVPPVGDGFCAESNPAVCPIVLGRKRWQAAAPAGSTMRTGVLYGTGIACCSGCP